MASAILTIEVIQERLTQDLQTDHEILVQRAQDLQPPLGKMDFLPLSLHLTIYILLYYSSNRNEIFRLL